MDNAEQSPRPPSKGIFDTASLLATSPTIFSSQSPTPVQSPLPHLAHSPSAFSVLGRNAVLIPPPSSNSDSTSPSGSSKMCSPIMHHSASDALSSLASSSVLNCDTGPCSWWSAASPIGSGSEFPGCGVPITDPFGRPGLCRNSPVSPAHLSVQQPRRIVEEVLGHLYAKPPSAESKNDSQTSGIPSPQTLCKTSILPNIVGVSPKKISKAKSSEKDSNHAKTSSEKCKTSNSMSTSISGISTVSGNQTVKSSSKKSTEPVNEQIARLLSTTEKPKRKSRPKASKPDSAKNGKSSKTEKKQTKQSKEKKAKKSSSESEGHLESSCSTTGPDSTGVVSSSSSDSSDDDEEREKQQKQLARLKRQQQELRRKVQELKQASHDSVHQKPEAHAKKSPLNSKNSLPSSGGLNHTLKPVPSPAHSSPLMPVSSKTMSPEIKSSICDPVPEEEQNLSFPLDLCMKKQEPTFEVTTSMTSSYIPATTTTVAKKKTFQVAGSNASGANNSSSNKLATAPKKRGRKPKAVQMPGNPPTAHSEKVRQIKRNSIKDIPSLLTPSKMDMLPGHPANSSLLKSGNPSSCPKVHAPNTLGNPNDILPHSRKNFTLDCLLSETNGNLHFPESDPNMFPTSSLGGNKIFKHKERQRNNNRMKKFEEKIKEPESPLRPETSSPSDSDPDDDNSDSDDTEHSHSESITDSASTPSGRKRKHSYDEDSEDYRNKKRRVLPDEREVQIPLEHGWRRETRIRCFSRSGVRGEVAYYTPCGKKLRSYPEVVRYLIKNGITDISRDNFTFSTKMNVGEFLEKTSSGSGQDYVLLSENEVIARIEEVRARKGRLGVQNRKSSSQHRSVEEEEQQRQWEQKQMQHHLEQQARSREVQESKMMRQAQREHALMAAREEKRIRAEESRKQKEQQRIMKQQEKFERMEQIRIEREIRAQQILEDQEMKRQQAVFLREQERERRRQHMILVRALENRKKQEERERKREEILFEKRINREKKMEQRRIELDYLRELKKPVDDMMLKDLMPLPTLNRIPGVKLCGKAFADVLMVFEFLHNFGETLGFDMDSLPTLNTLQTALLNSDEKCEEELLSVVHHLLVCVIDDPGIQHCPEAATVLGQSLKDADITNSNVSEVLRLFFIAQDKRSTMLEWLQTKPFLSLNATQKAEIISYLCDELLTSRLLTRQIDSNIENVNVLRKDKWLVEGDLRRYRSIQQRRALKARLSAMEENRDNPNCANMLSADIPDFSLAMAKDNSAANEDSDLKEAAKTDKEKLEEMENELANESGNESDDTQAPGQISDGEDEDLHLSNDEINKKIEKLTKQLTLCSNKLTKAFYTIRGATFGMDRYHRRYWVFPKSGGVYVESMESSLKAEEREKVLSESREPPVKKEEDEHESVVEESVDKESTEGNEKPTAEKTDSVEDRDDVSKMDTSVAEKIIDEPSDSKDVKPVVDKKLLTDQVKIKSEEKDDLKVTEESAKLQVDKSIVKKEVVDVEMAEPEPKSDVESADPINKDVIEEKSNHNAVNDNKVDNRTSANNSELKVNSTDKDSSKSLLDQEMEIDSPKKGDDEVKITSEVLASPLKKTWTPDKKSSNDSDITHNLKKEKDTKTKKDDKKDSRHKESENKFMDKVVDIKEEKKPNVNIFMPNLCDNSINLDLGAPKLHGKSDMQHPPNPSIPPDQNWLFNSPLFASILAGNMLFNGPLMSQRDMNGTYFNLPKNDSNNPFGPFLGLQPGMLSAEQIFKSLGEKPSNQKPWFSILPRMPCDESLLSSPQGRNSSIHSPANMCSPDVRSNSRVAHHSPTSNPPPGHVASALSNLQMELMNGVVPPGFFLHPFLPPQFGPTYQSTPPSTCSSHHSSFTSTMSHSSPMPDFNLNFNRPPPASTPNSIPTPSATPGPTSHGCATPTSRDTPSPCFTKRLLMEKMTQEYDAPQPVPIELQKGWWRITDPNQLKLVISALHHRGIREKMFQKQLQKHFTFACNSCSQGQGKETDLEITDMDKEVSKCVGGAPEPDATDFWYKDIALRVDMGILEQVENLEEKVDGSSMQVKCWKPPAKLSTEPVSKFVPACEQFVHRTADEIYDAIKEKHIRKSAKKSSSRKKKPAKKEQEPEPSEVDPEKKTEEEGGEAVVETENVEVTEPVVEDLDKSITEDPNKVESDIIPLPPGKLNPVEEAKKRLLKAEAAIERRYLRPPLGTRSQISGSGTSNNPPPTDSSEEENIPVGLVKWRNAVENCRTAAQLAMCLNFLETCTAWDKSIMRASCQFCHSGDNEEKLLLCDGCDKGYHTYCFKPVMETIPEGDWYCFECLNKATGDNVCVICGTKGKLVECETCPKTFHLTCLEPPLAKMPKGKWYCSGCNLTRPKKSSKKSNANKEKEPPKDTKETTEKTSKKTESTPSSKSKSSEKKKKEEKKKETVETTGNKDLAPCSTILEDMQNHEDAWPFLTPVNTKQFPTYRKVIKKPMDIATIKNKLEAGQYKCREDFANDARLIFDNCETFNEDESPVGQAGHSMRAFFETRWSELCST